MILPWLDLDENEIFNAARTVSYLSLIDSARNSGIWELSATRTPCDRLLGRAGDGELYPPFEDPAADYALTGYPSWYDADYPESAEFFGMIITDALGLSSVLSRNLTDDPDDGGRLGPQRRDPRVVTIKGVLVGSPCGTAYGARWLDDFLRSRKCVRCDDASFGFYKCCAPSSPEDDQVVGYWQIEASALGTGAVVRPLNKHDGTEANLAVAGCDIVSCQFELVAGNPYLYKPAVLRASGTTDAAWTIPVPVIGTDCAVVTWSDVTSGAVYEALGAVTLLTFDGLPASSDVRYDSATRKFEYLAPGMNNYEDASKYLTSLDAGAPNPWVEVDVLCTADPVDLSATGDGGAVTIYTRHREG